LCVTPSNIKGVTRVTNPVGLTISRFIFLAYEQTKALIIELETARICAVKTTKGRYSSTYASAALAIAYVAWISAVFHAGIFGKYHANRLLIKPIELIPLSIK